MSSAPAQHFLSVLPIQGWRRDHRGSRGEAGAGGLRRDRALRAPPCSVAPLGGRVWRGDPWLGPASVPFFPAILAETKGEEEEEEEALLGAPPAACRKGGPGGEEHDAGAQKRGYVDGFVPAVAQFVQARAPKRAVGAAPKPRGARPPPPCSSPPSWELLYPALAGGNGTQRILGLLSLELPALSRGSGPTLQCSVPRGEAGPGGLEESPCKKVPEGTPSL